METKIDTLRAEISDLIKKGDTTTASLSLEKLGDLFKTGTRYSMSAKYYAQAADYCFDRMRKLDLHQKSADAYSSAGSFYTASLQLEKVITLFLSEGAKELAEDTFEIIKNYLVPADTPPNKCVLERIEKKLLSYKK